MVYGVKEGFGKLASLEESLKIIRGLVDKKNVEPVSIDACLNRVLGKDIIAPIDVPGFRKSAMDGYAVRASDTFNASNNNPRELNVIESVTCGVMPKKDICENECIQITTGAPLPKSSDAVLKVEYTEAVKDSISCYKPVSPMENVIAVGSDIKEGDKVLCSGIILKPRHIGAISALGISEVNVYERPVIAYFSSGNEIIPAGEKLVPGMIYDINSHTILNAIRDLNCIPIDLGVCKDDLDDIKRVILDGIVKADLVLFSGGSSLGGEDHMVDAVNDLGEVLIHGIAVKPGKPVLVGKVDGKLVLGLPGYPASALSNFHLLMGEILSKMQEAVPKRQRCNLKLSRKIVSTIGRYEFMSVMINGDEAVPVMKGSSAITTLAEADGFIEISENTEVIEKGESVEVIRF